MKLYHGTNVSFDEIDLTKTKPAKDFGQGVNVDKMTQEQLQNFLISYTVDKLVSYLISDYKLSLAEALDVVYNSHTFECLNQTQNGLYAQSAPYVYDYLKNEYTTGSFA
jgi:hypothetical protein